MTDDATEAKRLAVDCPICRHDVDGSLRDHLLEAHDRETLVDELVACLESDDRSGYG